MYLFIFVIHVLKCFLTLIIVLFHTGFSTSNYQHQVNQGATSERQGQPLKFEAVGNKMRYVDSTAQAQSPNRPQPGTAGSSQNSDAMTNKEIDKWSRKIGA